MACGSVACGNVCNRVDTEQKEQSFYEPRTRNNIRRVKHYWINSHSESDGNQTEIQKFQEKEIQIGMKESSNDEWTNQNMWI